MRREGARLDRIPLAEVAVVVDDPDIRLLTGREESLGRAVDRSVGDDDQLDVLTGQAARHSAVDEGDVVDHLVTAVVDRDDDGQERSSGQARMFAGSAGRPRTGDTHRADSRLRRRPRRARRRR